MGWQLLGLGEVPGQSPEPLLEDPAVAVLSSGGCLEEEDHEVWHVGVQLTSLGAEHQVPRLVLRKQGTNSSHYPNKWPRSHRGAGMVNARGSRSLQQLEVTVAADPQEALFLCPAASGYSSARDHWGGRPSCSWDKGAAGSTFPLEAEGAQGRFTATRLSWDQVHPSW